MDFSKLGSNEKLAVYGAIAAIIGPVLSSVGFGFGAGGLTLLLSIAMLAIIFLPQFSPETKLPGSKGSLMVIVGGIAAVSAALALLGGLGYFGFFGRNIVSVLGWLVGIGGGLLMGWAGWQEFQSEGGKLQIGTASAGSDAGASQSSPPPAAPPTSPPPAAPPSETAAPPSQAGSPPPPAASPAPAEPMAQPEPEPPAAQADEDDGPGEDPRPA